jgi:pimeloyl-ACP methyl ester carboxylesterase
MKKIIGTTAIIVMATCLSILTFGQTLFTVQVRGTGKPIILIHGLYCTGDVWKETVERYKRNRECHILTLAGFGGNAPALKENFLGSVKDEIIQYAKTKRLNKPVIVGHSLGGFLAFWAAASEPELFAGVISVDGLPFLPAIQMPNATAESSKAMAGNMKNMMGNLTPEMTKANQKMYLPTMISDTTKIGSVVEMAVRSDAKTIGEVMYELFTTDLRGEVGKIKCPVQLQGAWIAYKDYGATHETALKGYQQQVASIKNVTVEISDKARHFIFYDDPAWFFEKTDGFLKSL